MLVKMTRDIVLFYYYSAHEVPESCYLNISRDVAHRNVFLQQCGNFTHFEFPTFEDHSYSSICNGSCLKKLIKCENGNEKYIIFRTKNHDNNDNQLIGYYKIEKAYYQETSFFDDNGFIWGIEAKPAYLIRKGDIKCEYSGRPCVTSWNDKTWEKKLNKMINEIEKKEDISDIYQKETNHLISIFKDIKKMEEWKTTCETCIDKKNCIMYKKFKNYSNRNNNNIFNVIHNVYTSNIYSKNVLDKIGKKYLKI
jgi:hypothetical protein